MNELTVTATSFPFHDVVSGNCKMLNNWIEQLKTTARPNDINILFIKTNKKGQYVCVPSNLTWMADNFMYYTSEKFGDWLLIEFEHFFKLNKDLIKTYSGSTDTVSFTNIQTSPISPTNIQ